MLPLTYFASLYVAFIATNNAFLAAWPSLLGIGPLAFYWWVLVRRFRIGACYRLSTAGVYVLLLGCAVSAVFGLPLLIAGQASIDTFVFGCAPFAAVHLIYSSTGPRVESAVS